jgi:IS5 family transposase
MMLEVMLRVLTNTAAHDSKVTDKLLHGEEKAVYEDKAYAGEDRQRDCESSGIEWYVKRKAVSGLITR